MAGVEARFGSTPFACQNSPRTTALEQHDLAGLAAIDLDIVVGDRRVCDRWDIGLDLEVDRGLARGLGDLAVDLQ